jgi:hypothetical protein
MLVGVCVYVKVGVKVAVLITVAVALGAVVASGVGDARLAAGEAGDLQAVKPKTTTVKSI